MDVCGIYKITCLITGKINIGQSKHCNRRKTDYKGLRCKKQTKLYNSILKYGWENHTFEVIHECEILELDFWEIHFIQLHNTYNSLNGLNLTPGGNRPPILNEAQRKSISMKNKGRPAWNKGKSGLVKHTEETKKIQSEKSKKAWQDPFLLQKQRENTRKSMTEERREENSRFNKSYWTEERREEKSKNSIGDRNPFFGKKHTPEANKKNMEFHKGKKGFNKGRKFPNQTGKNNKKSRAVIQLDKEGNVLKEYESISIAAKSMGNYYIRYGIRKACQGKQKTSKGFKWKYKNN